MKIYTVKFRWKSWTGKAANIGTALSEAAKALGVDLQDQGLSVTVVRRGV